MDARCFTVGPLQENCWIVRREESDRALVVDPGDEGDRLIAAIDGLTVDAILLTHTHFDHVGAVAPVARATGAPVYCPALETQVLADIMSYVPWPGFGPFESYEAEHTLAGGERLNLAGIDIEVLFTQGHSPGHLTFAMPGALLSGDVDLIEDPPTTDLAKLKTDPKITLARAVSNRAIYIHLDQHGDPPTVIARQNMIEQRGLSGAEIATDRRDGNCGILDRHVLRHFGIGNGLPSNTVPQIGMSRNSPMGTSYGSASRTVKSAFLPLQMLPISCSMPMT